MNLAFYAGDCRELEMGRCSVAVGSWSSLRELLPRAPDIASVIRQIELKL